MNPSLPITDEVFKYKAYLKLTGVSGEKSDYGRLQERLAAEYRRAARQERLKDAGEADVIVSPPSLPDAFRSSHSLIADVTVGDASEACRLDALEPVDPKQPEATGSYRPILFVHR